MRFRFFTIPVHGGEGAAAELNRCLAEDRVLAIDRQFVADGENSAWAVCVTIAVNEARMVASAKRTKIDYREVLSEEDFIVFADLRTIRKRLAEREGIPPYAVFTNEQLAAIVQNRAMTKGALKAIEGIGEARSEKYGAPILERMAQREAKSEIHVDEAE